MVIVHHILKEVVDVELRATVDDGLHLSEQFVEVESLGIGDVVECHLAVDALDDLHLQHRLLGNSAHTHVLGSHDVVFFTIGADEVAERLSIAFRLTNADALYVLQFLDGHGEHRRHLVERDILEDDVGRQVVFLCHLRAQVFEHGDECQVEGRANTVHVDIVVVVVELGVFDNHERMRVLQEALAGCRHLQQTIVLYLLAQIAGDECLTDDGIPNLVVFVLTFAKLLQLVVLMRNNVVGGMSAHEVNDIVLTEILLDGKNGLEHDDESVLALALLLRMQAVVAVLAVVLVVFLTEVMQQHLATAHTRLGIGGSLLQQLATDVLLGHRLSLHELLELLQVLIGIEGDADALAAVATGTSRLLVVAFEALRDVVVDDEAYVGFVDAHAKSNGCDDDIDSFHEEVVLRLGTCLRVEASMIGCGLDFIGLQHGSQLLHLLSR